MHNLIKFKLVTGLSWSTKFLTAQTARPAGVWMHHSKFWDILASSFSLLYPHLQAHRLQEHAHAHAGSDKNDDSPGPGVNRCNKTITLWSETMQQCQKPGWSLSQVLTTTMAQNCPKMMRESTIMRHDCKENTLSPNFQSFDTIFW